MQYFQVYAVINKASAKELYYSISLWEWSPLGHEIAKTSCVRDLYFDVSYVLVPLAM